MPRDFQSAHQLADAVIASVGTEIVVGLPIGIGKATQVVDALFERALADRSLSLTIFTGLTLEPPRGRSELERRFLKPLVDRLYGEWPTPAYASALRAGQLPPNIQVREFYLRPGGYLSNPLVQHSYTSANYSEVVDVLMSIGVNVVAQLVASRESSPAHLSLSSNPEITLDLLPRLEARRQQGHRIAIVGQVNRQLPYMTGEAAVARERFDFILDDGNDFPLFAIPNRSVSPADYATAMHTASLIQDGGTLQLGIGSLSDAVAHCLKLRNDEPAVFSSVLRELPGGTSTARRQSLPIESEPFVQGLFASTELMSDALFSLFEAGILRRCADDNDHAVVHAGFFVGSSKLYERLRTLPEHQREQIQMRAISSVNTLFGDEMRKRQQRRQGHFINETMMVTLLGAAIADGLDDGRVVSGVGGQFDFVAMAQALEGAQSILMCRARRVSQGKAQSNFRWSYGHTTVPRHYRDTFISEYGIAATRGKPDAEVIDAIISIAGAEFQPGLIAAAKRAAKVPSGYQPPADTANNRPESIESLFASSDVAPYFPAYPLGTDLTLTEQRLASALEWLKHNTAQPLPKLKTLAGALSHQRHHAHAEALERMGLAEPAHFQEKLLRRLVSLALERTKV